MANPATRIKTIWVISGPVFEQNLPKMTVGNGVGVPHGTYKVIGWFDARGRFRMRGYVIRQEDRSRTLARYLTSVDEVERKTGLDFFAELEDELENALEAESHRSLWD